MDKTSFIKNKQGLIQLPKKFLKIDINNLSDFVGFYNTLL
jgi:hypothetical protein